MPVQGEAARRGDHVVVEYAQRPKVHVFGVVIVVEREMPVRLKPFCFSMITVIRANRLDHGRPSTSRSSSPHASDIGLDAMGADSTQPLPGPTPFQREEIAAPA